MANRLLPFRQYNEHFVVNMFALDTAKLSLGVVASNTHAASGDHDAGLLVKVKGNGADLGAGYGSDAELNAYMGTTSYPHVGFNENPEAFGKFEPVDSNDDIVLGVTLNQTLAYDENGEKMLYYRQKALEHQAVLPGEAVPVLTKGIITVAANGVESGSAPTAGAQVGVSVNGKFRSLVAGKTVVGTCLAVGDRDGQYDSNAADYWATDGSTGAYYVIKIDL
jgi:hypothetical protein